MFSSEPANAVALAAKIQASLALPFAINGNEVAISASIGISSYASSKAGADAMLIQADLALYRSKLRDHGIVAFNVSNNYVGLEPVLGNLAHDARMACVAQADTKSGKDGIPETDASDWVVMARHTHDLRAVATDHRWKDCRRTAGTPWTDDYSNLLGALDLNR